MNRQDLMTLQRAQATPQLVAVAILADRTRPPFLVADARAHNAREAAEIVSAVLRTTHRRRGRDGAGWPALALTQDRGALYLESVHHATLDSIVMVVTREADVKDIAAGIAFCAPSFALGDAHALI